MGRTMNKLTKLVLSFLMVITCVNISSIRAEDGEDANYSETEVAEQVTDVEPTSEEPTQEVADQSEEESEQEETATPEETPSEPTEETVEEEAKNPNEMSSDELFEYIMNLSAEELDALYDAYPNLDDLMANFTEDQNAQLATKFGTNEVETLDNENGDDDANKADNSAETPDASSNSESDDDSSTYDAADNTIMPASNDDSTEGTSEGDTSGSDATVTEEETLDNFYITTSKKVITIGDTTATVTAHFEPDTITNKNVTWSSSNTDVVKVDGEGKISTVGIGNAIITATPEANPNMTATIAISVEAVKVNKVEIGGYSASFLKKMKLFN